MRRLCLLLLLVCGSLSASTLVVTKAGYFWLSVDSDGKPSLVKIEKIVTLTDETPVPNPDPEPVGPFARHRLVVQAATDEVSDPNKANTKKALAKLYRTIAGLPVTTKAQLDSATSTMFNALELPAVWVAWKAKVDRSCAGFESLDDGKSAWLVVAEVLEK